MSTRNERTQPAFRLEAIDKENLGDTVYARLAETLIKGRLAPETRLTIRELAQSLGTSVTPVRDAILRLIQDEALVQKSPREVHVPMLTPQRYQEIRQIRIKLEGLAARECAMKAGPAGVTRLRDLIARNELALQEKSWPEALELNQGFHFALAEIADLPVLRGILHRLWLQMGPLIAEAYPHGGRLMIDYHYDVLKAVEEQDPDSAELAIARDIGEAGAVIMHRLSARQGTES